MKDTTYNDSIERFLDLILNQGGATIGPDAIASAKIFMLDTVGVICAGAQAPGLDKLLAAAGLWGKAERPELGATVWNTGQVMPPPVAVLANAYQCHALEFDCVYEEGVVIPAAPIFSALMFKAEQLSNQGHPPGGEALLKAFVVAVEVSCSLGLAANGSMFFFRPGTAGTFGALAAMACLAPLSREQLRYAFGIAYAQMGGTMQAHEEGSMMLAMQMGFAARNAVQAYDMAAAGVSSAVQVLDGRFGYFNNFEHGNKLPEAIAQLGAPWKVTRLSHKPFPSGRVTHGTIRALRELRNELALAPEQAYDAIKAITLELPALGMQLVGRPMRPSPAPNYARLCVPFVAATELLYGSVDPTSFYPDRLADPAIEALAQKVNAVEAAHPNPNAFYPQKLIFELQDGRVFERPIPYAWGHPDMPLNRTDREEKFMQCYRLGRGNAQATHSEEKISNMIHWFDNIESHTDCQELLKFLAVSNS
ncbi:MmgE/PrpD family protein [Pusillimonas sp. ANT_WB101]|uniref:MmgE/PrpD family protein n=1 Tax=Pusillimonas sp. ANT_WB101 TaxID=2597356 RepID=UPI00165E4269|nr:MmgE/PrpD family protein [Pusillimonas sp. ANT_WB101]